MRVAALDYFRLMPEFLPADLQLAAIYVRPNELSVHVDDVPHWELVGRTFHPNKLQAADVERQGYCLRKLPTGIRANWYEKKPS
jgi:hypothetical protein